MRKGQTPEERLREALLARVDYVEPAPDALPRIRQRTARRRSSGWAVFGAGVAVAAALAAAVVVVVNLDQEQAPRPAQSATSTPPARSSEPPLVVPAPTDSPAQPGRAADVNLPVYYAHSGRLYREFHRLHLTADGDTARIAAALGESLRDSALDPDYDTLWPDGVTVHGVTIDNRTVTVDLGSVGTQNAAPQLAVQQLVYTVSAATAYTSLKRADGVRILVDGAPVARLWGSVDTSAALRQAPAADVQGQVWVIDPQQGSNVGQRFTVHLAGSVFEGTVNVRIRGTAGKVSFEQVVQLDVGAPAVGEARVPVTLAPGRYTIEAYFVSVKDGSVQAVDDHEFTVG